MSTRIPNRIPAGFSGDSIIVSEDSKKILMKICSQSKSVFLSYRNTFIDKQIPYDCPGKARDKYACIRRNTPRRLILQQKNNNCDLCDLSKYKLLFLCESAERVWIKLVDYNANDPVLYYISTCILEDECEVECPLKQSRMCALKIRQMSGFLVDKEPPVFEIAIAD